MKALPFAKFVKRPARQAFRQLSYRASLSRMMRYKSLVIPAPDLPRFLRFIPQEMPDQGMRFVVSACRNGPPIPQTNAEYKFREAASGLRGLYIHDDRLGPYAFADLAPLTDPKSGNVQNLCLNRMARRNTW